MAYITREYTNKLLELLDEGAVDGDQLARDLLSWCSEDSVKQFWGAYGFYEAFERDEEEEDTMDDEEWEEVSRLV